MHETQPKAAVAYGVVIAFSAIVAAPIVEELFFRGMLMRLLRRTMPAALAIVLQGLAFGAYHWVPSLGLTANLKVAIPLAGTGIAFGIVAHREKRLGPTIIAHCVNNIVATQVIVRGAFG